MTDAPTQPYASTHGGADTLKCNVFRHNTTQHTVLEATQMWAALQAHASPGEHTCSALSARHTSLLERGPDGEDLLRGEDRKPQL